MLEVSGVSLCVKYGDFEALVEWDDEAKCFYAVIYGPDYIHSHGDTIDELMQSFADSVDTHMEQGSDFQKV
jgi:predicted RNase H-like HicB family nuclease